MTSQPAVVVYDPRMGSLERAPGKAARVYTTAYPADEVLVEWSRGSSLTKVAARIGVRRESLRDYLNRRPELDAAVREVLRGRLTPEQRTANQKRADAAWKAAHPDQVRAIRRKWARNQDPAKRQRWNEHNRRRRAGLKQTRDADTTAYVELIRRDPCAYCGNAGGTVDHVVPVASRGDDHWTNYAGACGPCNASKNDRPLLSFLLARALETDRSVA